MPNEFAHKQTGKGIRPSHNNIMKIQSLKLHNFRCFDEKEFQFHDKITIINELGRSSILDALSIAAGTFFRGLYGFSGKPPFICQTDSNGCYPVEICAEGYLDEISVQWKRKSNNPKDKYNFSGCKEIIAVSTDYQKRLSSGDNTLILPIIAKYSFSKMQEYSIGYCVDFELVNTRSNGYIDVLTGISNKNHISYWFIKTYVTERQRMEESSSYEIPEANAVYNVINRCIEKFTGYTDVHTDYKISAGKLFASYYDTNIMTSRFVPLYDMIGNLKSTIDIIIDICCRMSMLNPQLLANITETPGIILIDDIDLSPYANFPEILKKLFPNVQFILTLHEILHI